MRLLVAFGLLVLCGCNPGLQFNPSTMTPDQMLQRASLVFVGVIQEHHLEYWPFFRVPTREGVSGDSRYWKILRRRVRVELAVRGSAPHDTIDVYEIFWTGGASGDWNATQDGERSLFLVRVENGRYHVVRDWWRSIFPITSGPHRNLPLTEAAPPWERVALLNWWLPADPTTPIPAFHQIDPGQALSQWRTVKLLRGLVSHPSREVRVSACRELIVMGLGQDECWETLSAVDREQLQAGRPYCCSAEQVRENREKMARQSADWWWARFHEREERQTLTAFNNKQLRQQFCRMWESTYPEDHDNGCPADQPPPATIVTAQGDIPLMGRWPLSGQE